MHVFLVRGNTGGQYEKVKRHNVSDEACNDLYTLLKNLS